MHQPTNTHADDHAGGYGIYLKVWLGLIVFTGITVAAAGVDLKSAALTIALALLIASVKTSLVVYFFMHIKYEHLLFKLMLAVCAITFIIFIGLTFFDIAYR